MPCNHNQCREDALKAAEEVCLQLGARFTDQRRRVLEAIWQSHKALSAAEIMKMTGNSQPPTTYRALDFLKEAGLVHHIASLNAYAGCLHAEEGKHVGQLLVCTACRTVTELAPQDVVKSLVAEAGKQGFHPAHTRIEMLGLCRECGARA